MYPLVVSDHHGQSPCIIPEMKGVLHISTAPDEDEVVELQRSLTGVFPPSAPDDVPSAGVVDALGVVAVGGVVVVAGEGVTLAEGIVHCGEIDFLIRTLKM